MDKRTRKMLMYLIDKELKTYKTFPEAWIEDSKFSLEQLKQKIADCEMVAEEKDSKGRRLSKYNLFIKQCATSVEKGGQGKNFKECVKDWKGSK